MSNKQQHITVTAIYHRALLEKISKLEAIKDNSKVFIYMVIHELKHPTEAVVDSLSNLTNEVQDMNKSLLMLKNKASSPLAFSRAKKANTSMKSYLSPRVREHDSRQVS